MQERVKGEERERGKGKGGAEGAVVCSLTLLNLESWGLKCVFPVMEPRDATRRVRGEGDAVSPFSSPPPHLPHLALDLPSNTSRQTVYCVRRRRKKKRKRKDDAEDDEPDLLCKQKAK